MARDLSTCHASPWALVRRNGDTVGKRISTRMAYLVGTIAPKGKGVALTGYIMNGNMNRWTKHPQRIELGDIIRCWSQQPSVDAIRQEKKNLPVAGA